MTNKKNLGVLLVLPFVVSLLGISVISGAFNLIDNDIIGINWEYDDTIGLKAGTSTQLKAYGVNNKNYPVTNIEFVWKVENKNQNEEPHATIDNDGLLTGLTAGEIKITVLNKTGTLMKSIDGLIYEGSAFVVNNAQPGSQSNIDPIIKYGQYDLDENDNKVPAIFEYTIKCFGSYSPNDVKVIEYTPNVQVDESTKTVKIVSYGEANIKFGLGVLSSDTYTATFEIIKDAINVYDYDDLLYCTNKSKDGEIVCLRKNFESLDNTYYTDDKGVIGREKSDNTTLFGHYDQAKKKYSFKDEIYQFKTTYNNEYIKQWNEFAKNNKSYKEISDLVNVGLHVQKDFYGNGYTINMHNLAFPSKPQNQAAGTVWVLGDDDLFRGPLPFYYLGDPNTKPLVGAYGQDNIGMYVDGDDISINDLVLKNCDFGNNLVNLEYTGTVMETYGDNIVIEDCRLSNGKTVFKCNSSLNTTLKNTMLSYSRNFLVSLSSEEYVTPNEDTKFLFADDNKKFYNEKLSDFLNKDKPGDTMFNNYLKGIYNEYLKTAVENTQSKLDSTTSLPYKSTLVIEDCLFYLSGIASIGLETMFNGPFLYSSTPSLIQSTFDAVSGASSSAIIPFYPSRIGGTSYPCHLLIKGSTKFYDYKKVDNIDLSGLILENISAIYNSLNPSSSIRNITIDDIFPLISILRKRIEANGSLVRELENSKWVSYVNIPIAYYGGGLNLSKVTFDEGASYKGQLSPEIPLSFLDEYLQSKYAYNENDGFMAMMKKMLVKCVTVVTGFNDFKFVCSKNDRYLFKETPNVSTLINNKKENKL